MSDTLRKDERAVPETLDVIHCPACRRPIIVPAIARLTEELRLEKLHTGMFARAADTEKAEAKLWRDRAEAAEASLRAVTEERDYKQQLLEALGEDYKREVDRSDRAEASLRDLQEGIRTYGQHTSKCAKWVYDPFDLEMVVFEAEETCTCGFDQLLTRLGSPAGVGRVGQQEEQEQETHARMDTMGGSTASRTAPTNELIQELEWAKSEGLGAMCSEESEFAVGPDEHQECRKERVRFETALNEAIRALSTAPTEGS